MITYSDSLFSSEQDRTVQIPSSAKIVAVADMFAEDYSGGAELTTQALLDASPVEVFKIRSNELSMKLLEQGSDKFWIFGNFTQLNPQLIPSIVANLKYAVLEYDYKYCKARSPEKHKAVHGSPCDCSQQMNGKMVSAFYYGARALFWMSEKQKAHYEQTFPFLKDTNNLVLSSVFSKDTLARIKLLREQTESQPQSRSGWLVLGSGSWIKGAHEAEEWCIANGKDYETVWNVSYDEMLAKLSQAEGLVFLPKGGDTCPRLVIEAKLLGCKLQLNDNVEHKDEEWFATDDLSLTESYLYAAPGIFWNTVKQAMKYRPTISGYLTVYMGASRSYPFVEAIESLGNFCDELCVVDGGSNDGTLETLAELAYLSGLSEPEKAKVKPALDAFVSEVVCLAENNNKIDFPDELGGAKKDPRLKIRVVPRDWDSPRFAVFDGQQKAEARSMCTQDFCWQLDADELVHEDDVEKIMKMCDLMPRDLDIVALPVIEYWGGSEKVRVDVNPWKWRLSRNKPYITHGIPAKLRAYDDHGDLYALPGTDGCDMIHAESHEPLPFMNFCDQNVDAARRSALAGDQQALKQYEQWLNKAAEQLPTVFHYSWYDLPRKIRLYREYWTQHWVSLFGGQYGKTADENMMFDVPWDEVTDEMIEERAALMKEKLGGWIWHEKWDGTTTTPHVTVSRVQPALARKIAHES